MTGIINLAILMPCLNEAEIIARCINNAKVGLARAGVPGQVLMADNGSKDGSPGIVIQLGARIREDNLRHLLPAATLLVLGIKTFFLAFLCASRA